MFNIIANIVLFYLIFGAVIAAIGNGKPIMQIWRNEGFLVALGVFLSNAILWLPCLIYLFLEGEL